MAKVRIPVEKLPPPDKDGFHIIQFRIVSDDRNRRSAWSPFNKVKSIGQYKPQESDVTIEITDLTLSVTWDTPTLYNLGGAEIVHNHSQNFKRHDTDIFVKWDEGYYEYHDRISVDTTSISIPVGSTSVQILALIATYGLPEIMENETQWDFAQRLENHINDLSLMFKVFETETISLV